MTPTFIPTVEKTLRDECLVAPGATIVVGVSGGPDSTALLAALEEIRSNWRLDLVAAHFDHAVRPNSASDREIVRALAAGLRIPFVSERRDTTDDASLPGGNNREARLREARYGFLRRVAHSLARRGPIWIAVGHTADDVLETMLLQILRGTGVRGLSHPRALREDGVIRPLLDVTRREVREYVASRGLSFVDDPTNTDDSNLRSRLRRAVLPFFEEENPNAARCARRTSRIFADADEALRSVALEVSKVHAKTVDSGEILLDGAIVQTYHRGIVTTVLREAIAQITSGRHIPDFETLDRWERAWRGGENLTSDFSCDLQIRIHNRQVRISRKVVAWAAPPRTEIPVPGEVSWKGAGSNDVVAKFSTKVETGELRDGLRHGSGMARLDRNRLAGQIVVRGREPGDRYQPAGLRGSAKVHDLMINQKIPRSVREIWPVVADDEGILWLPGFRVSDRAQVTAETREIVRLEATLEFPSNAESKAR